jgi:hypothetical protein
MKQVNDITEELNSMGSQLAGMSRAMPYTLPDGYFEQFANNTASLVNDLTAADDAPVWGRTMPFEVPQGYFETAATDMAMMAMGENIAAALPKGIPLTAPAGYFDALPAKMLHAAKATELPKQQKLSFRNIRWAAAAMVILSIGIGAYEFSNQQQNAPDNILASVSNNDIHDYLQQSYRLDVDRIMSNTDINNMQVDNKEIVQYLNETGWDITE